MFTFSQFVDALIKGHGHRYIKRIPYMTPKGRRYRYIYKVTHSHKGKQAIHEDHLDVGTKFMLHTESGKEVHGHIKSVDGDKVTYVIDDGADKGKEVTGTKAEILAMLNEKHGVEEKLREKRDQLQADIEQARKTGTEKQVARLEAQLKRLGGEPAKEESDNFETMPESKAEPVKKKSESQITREKLQAVDRGEYEMKTKELRNPKMQELLDSLRSEINVDRFIKEGRRREDTAEREVKKLQSTLDRLEDQFLNRGYKYTFADNQGRANVFLERDLPKIVDKLREMVSVKLSILQLTGGAGQRNIQRQHKNAEKLGYITDQLNFLFDRLNGYMEDYENTDVQERREGKEPKKETKPKAKKETKPKAKKETKSQDSFGTDIVTLSRLSNENSAFQTDLIYDNKDRLKTVHPKWRSIPTKQEKLRKVAGLIIREVAPFVHDELKDFNSWKFRDFERKAVHKITGLLERSVKMPRQDLKTKVHDILYQASREMYPNNVRFQKPLRSESEAQNEG